MTKLKKFDFVMMILALVFVILVGYKFYKPSISQANTNAVDYAMATVVYEINGVRSMTVDAFKVGDALLSDESNAVVGTISHIDVQPFYDALKNDKGQIVYAPVPEKYAIVVTVDTEILERGNGYFAQGITEIKVNSETAIYTKRVKVSCKVKDLSFD